MLHRSSVRHVANPTRRSPCKEGKLLCVCVGYGFNATAHEYVFLVRNFFEVQPSEVSWKNGERERESKFKKNVTCFSGTQMMQKQVKTGRITVFRMNSDEEFAWGTYFGGIPSGIFCFSHGGEKCVWIFR